MNIFYTRLLINYFKIFTEEILKAWLSHQLTTTFKWNISIYYFKISDVSSTTQIYLSLGTEIRRGILLYFCKNNILILKGGLGVIWFS